MVKHKSRSGAVAGGRTSGHSVSRQPSLSSLDPQSSQPTPWSDPAGAHGEIARRYQRKSGLRDKKNLRLAELRKLRHVRTEASQSTAEIDAVIADNGAPGLNGRDLGALLDFTFLDYKSYGAAAGRHPATIRPNDATGAEIEAYLKAFHRPRKSAAKRQRYAKRRAAEAERLARAEDLDCRRSSIWVALDEKWQTVAEIMKALARSSAFRTRDGKRFLTGDSLSRAIRRELEHPALATMIEIAGQTGKRGLIEKLIRRL
jgi:hypothetical protein